MEIIVTSLLLLFLCNQFKMFENYNKDKINKHTKKYLRLYKVNCCSFINKEIDNDD